jgi:hypothetical protein
LKFEWKRPHENLDIGVRVTFKWMLTKKVHEVSISFFWLRIDTSGRLY